MLLRNKKGACVNVDTSRGLLKFKGAIFDEKKRLRHCGHLTRASRIQKFAGMGYVYIYIYIYIYIILNYYIY